MRREAAARAARNDDLITQTPARILDSHGGLNQKTATRSQGDAYNTHRPSYGTQRQL